MTHDADTPCAAFDGGRKIAAGPLREVLAAVMAAPDPDRVLVFADDRSWPLELDLRGSLAEALDRLPRPAAAPKGPGRPKLGVVAREVTLLPRHWDWLAAQPGGASTTLRRLVEAARRDPVHQAAEAMQSAYRFMTIVGGDRPGYEDAVRALTVGDAAAFAAALADWPADLRDHAETLAGRAFRS
ncbi:MAG: DUF2239 family protein [Pseudomonadota bacterium]